MTIKIFVAMIVSCLFISNAFAENLKFIGTLNPNGMKIYADKDSVVRRAHMSRINLVLILASAGNHPDEKMPMDFDCDEKIYQLPDGRKAAIGVPFSWNNSGMDLSMSGETITSGFAIACKKLYEFWK